MTSSEGPQAQAGSAEQRDAEDDDLANSLGALSVLSPGLPLTEMLTRVARYAVRAIPGADGAGLTLIEQHRSDTIVTTADFVSQIDAVQSPWTRARA